MIRTHGIPARMGPAMGVASLLAVSSLVALAGASGAEPVASPGPSPPPYPVGVWEYVPPAPWVDPSTLDLANHTQRYAPLNSGLVNQPQSVEPQAFDFRKGDIKVIVILAEFSDVPHRSSNGQAYYNQVVNGNTSVDRSMRTYFYENSYGAFTVIGTVVGWVTLPNTMAYYNAYTNLLARDSAIAANSLVDFSQFDLNGDGYVDNLVIIHSGGDEALGCGSECIWSHAGVGSPYRVDGVWVSGYCTIAEFGVAYGDALGVLLHEFGHLGLDLPDLYDTRYRNGGLDDWDLMAGGAWGGSGWAPSHLSVWSKDYIGWEEPYDVPYNLNGYTIYPTSDVLRHNPIRVSTNYTNEYFLVEMRSRTASTRYDTAVPYSGLLILHVDSNVIANTWESNCNCVMYDTNHKGVDIEEKGTQHLDQGPFSNGGSNAANDVWSSDASGFTPTSTPNSNLYVSGGSYVSGVRVFNISAVLTGGGPHMTINVDTGRVNFNLLARVVGPAEKVALPAQSAIFRVEVTTLAASGDTVSLQVEGLHASRGSLDRTTATLAPFGTEPVNLTVTIPSDWGAGEPAYVSLRATSLSASNVTAVAFTLTRTGQLYSISVVGSLDATDVVPGINRTLSLDVRNLGNGLDNVTVSPIFSLSEMSMAVPVSPTGETYFFIGRGNATAISVTYNVLNSVPAGTVLPVSLDVRHGPSPGLHTYVYGNVTVGRRAVVEVEPQVGPLTYLEPGVPKVISLAVHNRGNYFSTFDLSAAAPPGVVVIFDVPSLPVSAFTTVTVSATVTAAEDVPAWTTGDIYLSATGQDGLASHTVGVPVQVSQRYEVLLTGEPSGTGAPGTNVLFALVATNFGNGQDAVRLTVSPSFSEWNASLSMVNFTLSPTGSAKSANLLFSVTVPPAARGNTVQVFALTLLSQQAGANSTLVVSIVVTPIYAFAVDSSAAQTGIRPSETASFLLSFENTGNVDDTYSVTVSGLPDAWDVEFAEGSGLVGVGPGFTGALTLLLDPPESVESGSYDFQIFATSEGDLVRRKILLETITVFSHREIAVRVSAVDSEVRPGALVTVQIVVENRGNVQERVFLTSAGAFGDVTFDPFELTVGAYEEVTATALVLVQSAPAGGYGALVVTATSLADSSVYSEGTVGITVTSPPAKPSPGLEAAALAAALALSAAAAAATRRRRRAGP